MNQEVKACKDCGQEKHFAEFSVMSRKYGTRAKSCRKCVQLKKDKTKEKNDTVALASVRRYMEVPDEKKPRPTTDTGRAVRFRNLMNFENWYTPEQVKEMFSYDPETGELKKKLPNGTYSKFKGFHKVTDNERPRFYVVCKNNRRVSAGSIVQMFITGKWPLSYVRYKDGDPFNLKLDNLLFDAPDTGTGYKGVTHIPGVHRDSYIAKYKAFSAGEASVGSYKTAWEAARAFNRASIYHFGEEAVINLENKRLGIYGELTDEEKSSVI